MPEPKKQQKIGPSKDTRKGEVPKAPIKAKVKKG
jgi:hypothetical protein